jgi:hypothetical protein
MGNMKILPPRRSSLPARPTSSAPLAPSINPGGVIASTLTRWKADRDARTAQALTRRTHAETELFEAQAQAAESYVNRQRAAARVQELPEMNRTRSSQLWKIGHPPCTARKMCFTWPHRRSATLTTGRAFVNFVDASGMKAGVIVEENLAEINRAACDASQEYFFARDFSKCPT